MGLAHVVERPVTVRIEIPIVLPGRLIVCRREPLRAFFLHVDVGNVRMRVMEHDQRIRLNALNVIFDFHRLAVRDCLSRVEPHACDGAVVGQQLRHLVFHKLRIVGVFVGPVVIGKLGIGIIGSVQRRVVQYELQTVVIAGVLYFLHGVQIGHAAGADVVCRVGAVIAGPAEVMLHRVDHILHAGGAGCFGPLIRIEIGGVKQGRRIIHADRVVALPAFLAVGVGVNAVMREHAELQIDIFAWRFRRGVGSARWKAGQRHGKGDDENARFAQSPVITAFFHALYLLIGYELNIKRFQNIFSISYRLNKCTNFYLKYVFERNRGIGKGLK